MCSCGPIMTPQSVRVLTTSACSGRKCVERQCSIETRAQIHFRPLAASVLDDVIPRSPACGVSLHLGLLREFGKKQIFGGRNIRNMSAKLLDACREVPHRFRVVFLEKIQIVATHKFVPMEIRFRRFYQCGQLASHAMPDAP